MRVRLPALGFGNTERVRRQVAFLLTLTFTKPRLHLRRLLASVVASLTEAAVATARAATRTSAISLVSGASASPTWVWRTTVPLVLYRSLIGQQTTIARQAAWRKILVTGS